MWVSENFSFLGTWVNKGKEKGRSPTLDPGQWLTRGFSYTRVMPTVLRIDTEDAHHDEGNAYVRLGDVLSRLSRKDEARDVYEKGVRQAEKHGHSGMADDLPLALLRLND